MERNEAGMKISRAQPYYKMMVASSLASYVMHLHPYSPTCCVQSELGMQVNCIGGQRGGFHHLIVGLCS